MMSEIKLRCVAMTVRVNYKLLNFKIAKIHIILHRISNS